MSKLHQSKAWKWLIFIGTIIIFLCSILYTNRLVKNIAIDERKKINIWANTIQRNAQLVKHTNAFFKNIREEEEKRALILAEAFQKITNASPEEDIAFYSKIISENQTIPYILADKEGNVSATKNLDDEYLKTIDTPEKLQSVLELENYNTIPINYYKKHYVYLYYKESNVYTQLRIVLEDLIKNFFSEIINNSSSVPVIITDSSRKNVFGSGNIDPQLIQDSVYVAKLLKTMESQNTPIQISLGNIHGYVFYQDSLVLKQIKYFPIIQFLLVFVFFCTAYLLFNFAWKAEQNQVWAGMSKETAHQLGTPLSSLMAWMEILESENVNPEIITEIGKDVSRLETIAQRFSKIGSKPNLAEENLQQTINDFIAYFKNRTSSHIHFKIEMPEEPIYIKINKHLFEWVIENLYKNAVDAMNGNGTITIRITEEKKFVFIDIQDMGKGIESKHQKDIFKPGFTTKSRGWGLGLTLSKRIIKDYHKGKLEIKQTSQNKGTTFRIKILKES